MGNFSAEWSFKASPVLDDVFPVNLRAVVPLQHLAGLSEFPRWSNSKFLFLRLLEDNQAQAKATFPPLNVDRENSWDYFDGTETVHR